MKTPEEIMKARMAIAYHINKQPTGNRLVSFMAISVALQWVYGAPADVMDSLVSSVDISNEQLKEHIEAEDK